MHIIIKKAPPGRDDWTDPRIRKLASDAWDEAESLPLKAAAKRRREHLKEMRFARWGKEQGSALGERMEREEVAQMRAIRRNMEKRINEL